MPCARLNLAALRERRLPGMRPDAAPLPTLSRRELIGAAGAAAAIISPAVRAVGDSLKGPFEFKHENDRATFSHAGREYWVIDPSQFDGSPELRVDEADRLITVTLAGAKYPGTPLPADFKCEIRRGLSGWKMKFQHALGGFNGRAPFEQWLTGQAILESAVKLNSEICSVGGEAPVLLKGRAYAEYRPDGGFRFRGDSVIEFEGENPLASDHFEMRILSGSDPSIFEKSAKSRTLVTLHREDKHWPLRPVVEDVPAGEVRCYSDAFETLQIEISPNGSHPLIGLLAESGPSAGEVTFRPHPTLQSSDYGPFDIRLRNTRYAIAFEQEGPRTALIADYDGASWMHGSGCSVLVGEGPNAAPFEILGRSGKTESMTVAPALLGYVAPIPGAVVEPALIPEGEVIHFEAEATGQVQLRPQSGISTQLNRVKLNPQFAHIGIIAAGRTRVVRPEDMLALEFQFINLRFDSGGGAPKLVRSNASQAAYLVVHFPPQHISEEAGLETTGSNKQPLFTPPAGFPTRPARTRIAGPSRLAFLVPNSVQAIPYTIDGLLDWAKLVPSVVPGADPPPAPIRIPSGALTLPASGSVTRIAAEIDDDNLVRLSKSALRTQSRGFDLAKMATIRPNLAAVTPQALPPVQPVPKPGIALKTPGVAVQVAPNIAALLQNKTVREPHAFETAIEFPYRVTLSPHDLSGWAHDSEIKKSPAGRTELWHTRLGTLRNGKVDEDDDYYRTVRAVWSEDYTPTLPVPNPPNPFTMSLFPRHRNQVVWRSAEWTKLDQAGRTVIPRPIPAEQFMLTPLGASVDMHGKWDLAVKVPLLEWVHKAQLGRDNFVRVEEAGYLMPFGHRAVLVTVTERKFWSSGQERFAMLFQKQFVEVKEPEKSYPLTGMRDGGNRMPFTRVVIKTKRTPNMDNETAKFFFPKVAGTEFRFSAVGTDRTGKDSEFSLPMMFVLTDLAHTKPGADGIPAVVKLYNSNAYVKLRTANMQGQKIGFAPAASLGDTVLDTYAIDWKSDHLTSTSETRVPFGPAMATAGVSIPAARAIADANQSISVEYPELYYMNGFGGPNAAAQIYLRITGGDALQLRYDTGGKGDKAGGMASPNTKITGLSRKQGVVGGPIGGVGGAARDLPAPAATRGLPDGWKFNPKDFFGDAAKLLGFLALKDIIPNEMGGDGRNAPKLTTKEEETKVTTTLEWKPDLNKPVLPSPLDKLFVPYDEMLQNGKYAGVLEIKCALTLQLGPQDPTYDILGRANKFTMELFECVRMKFDYVQFTAKSGAGVDVKPKFGKDWIEFIGPLSFVNKLKDLLPGSKSGEQALLPGEKLYYASLGGPLSPSGEAGVQAGTRGESKDLFDYFIDPSPSGIRAGFTINIPSVSVGVFSLQNIGVGAEIDIPFTGDPLLLTFNFCSRDNPMLLSVWIFGGGGWFNLTVGLDGITGFEASFQFGVTASISFGIASGGVSVMAGVTYNYERVAVQIDGKSTDSAGNELHEDRSKLTGYFEANGWVDVLGLISASLELYLGLEYISQGGQSELWGTARITFRIEILFLEFEVSAEVEKRFAGSGPSNRELPTARALPAGASSRAAVTSAMGGVKFADIYSEPEWNEYCLAFA